MNEPHVINGSDDFEPMPPPQPASLSGAGAMDPVPFQFHDIRALAAKILKRAQEQGQAKIDAARQQVAQMEKQAYDKAYQEAFSKGRQEGFAKGEKEGMAAAETKIADAIEQEKQALRQSIEPVRHAMEKLVGVLYENRQHLVAQAEADLLMLALDLAKRLVGHELSTDPEAIRPLAVECIGLVTDRSSVSVRVNPDDRQIVQNYLPELEAIFTDLGPVALEEDPSLERGDIIAATRESEVDMRLATRLAGFEQAILGFSGAQAEAPWNGTQPEAKPLPSTGQTVPLLQEQTDTQPLYDGTDTEVAADGPDETDAIEDAVPDTGTAQAETSSPDQPAVSGQPGERQPNLPPAAETGRRIIPPRRVPSKMTRRAPAAPAATPVPGDQPAAAAQPPPASPEQAGPTP